MIMTICLILSRNCPSVAVDEDKVGSGVGEATLVTEGCVTAVGAMVGMPAVGASGFVGNGAGVEHAEKNNAKVSHTNASILCAFIFQPPIGDYTSFIERQNESHMSALQNPCKFSPLLWRLFIPDMNHDAYDNNATSRT
jgi:hypothetical protein